MAQFGPVCWQSRVLGALTGVFVRPVLALLTGIGIMLGRFAPRLLQRVRLDVLAEPPGVPPPLPQTQVTRVTLPSCPAEWVVAPVARGSKRVVVYFPGSAVVTLGPDTHRRFASKLSAATGAQVFSVGYRLAPVSIGAAVSGGLDAYRRVLSLGFSPEHIVLAGDSTGGLMATTTAIAVRDAGLPVPAGQVLLSPLTSADMDIKHRATKQRCDVLLPFATVKFLYNVFVAGIGTRHRPPMPAEADLHGLGPFLLQAGTDEMLINDTLRLAEQLASADVPAWVQLWHKAMHMFQLSFDVNPDARRAVEELADFVRYVTAVADEASA